MSNIKLVDDIKQIQNAHDSSSVTNLSFKFLYEGLIQPIKFFALLFLPLLANKRVHCCLLLLIVFFSCCICGE